MHVGGEVGAGEELGGTRVSVWAWVCVCECVWLASCVYYALAAGTVTSRRVYILGRGWEC